MSFVLIAVLLVALGLVSSVLALVIASAMHYGSGDSE